jgi:hypothetical protein
LLVVDCDHKRKSSCAPADAPIRLRMADGAIIRNNVIVLSGTTPQRILSIFDTTGTITLEGNTFVGLERLEDAVSVQSGPAPRLVMRNNRIDNSPFSKFWARYGKRRV